MIQQYIKQLVPMVCSYNEQTGISTTIPGIDVMEITPMSNSLIAKHAGEDGTVFADTRVRRPAQYRVVLAVPESDVVITDVHKNLLDASYSPMQKYTVTSYFSRCWNMVVTSSRNTDKPDMQGLRLQEVMFEECYIYDASSTGSLDKVKNAEDATSSTQPIQSTSTSS